MRRFKKVLAVLMTLFVSVSTVKVPVFAEEINVAEQTLQEKINNEVMKTVKDVKSEKDVTDGDNTSDKCLSTGNEESVSQRDIIYDETDQNGWNGEITENIYETEKYKVTFILNNHWSNGYNASIRIENVSENVIENWCMSFNYDSIISNIWNANIQEEKDGIYIIKNAGWNRDIAVGGYVEFGLSGQEAFLDFPNNYKMIGVKETTKEEDYTIDYNIGNDWGNGCTGTITIINNTSTAIESWSIEFDCNNEITNIWDAAIEYNIENHYVVKNVGYNSNIAANGSVSFGVLLDKAYSDNVFSNFKLCQYTEKTDTWERDKEPLESIGEAYFKKPAKEDIVTDEETGLCYVRNQLLVSAYIGADKSIIEEIAEEVGAEIVGYIELTNDYQFEFIEDNTIERIQEIADYIDSFSFISTVTLNVINDVVPLLTKSNDAAYNNGGTYCIHTMDLDDHGTKTFLYNDTGRPDDWNEDMPDGDNWGLEALNVLTAWDHKDEFVSVKVGIYDSNFGDSNDLSFEDIVNKSSNISEYEHGTMVAGVLAAKHNNNEGISGIATDTRLYGYDYTGVDYDSAMEDKFAYAILIGNNIKVINVSVGTGAPVSYIASNESESMHDDVLYSIKYNAEILEEYLNKLVSQGYDFVIVCAGGNSNNKKFVKDSSGTFGYREYDSKIDADKTIYGGIAYAQYGSVLAAIEDAGLKERIIVVGAMEHIVEDGNTNYKYADFSNIGDRVDVCAPGVDILTTVSSGYSLFSGTSVAAPYISSLAAMMYQINPYMNAANVKSYMKLSSSKSIKDDYGNTYNIPNAAKCYEYAKKGYTDADVNLILPTGILTGYTKDSKEKCVSNVKITALRKSTGEYNLDGFCFSFESDSTGSYLKVLPQGTYDLVIYAKGYLPYAIKSVVILPDQTKYLDDIILTKKSSSLSSSYSINGKVINALNGTNIGDATIKLRKGWNTTSGAYVKTLLGAVRNANTNSDGTFSLAVGVGAYTAEVSRNGYVTGYYNVIASDNGGSSDSITMVLTPVLSDDEYRIILTWGDSPRDLDSHLTYYVSDLQQFHLYYGNKTVSYEGDVVAKLDLDDITSYGPETTTITLDKKLLENGGVFKYSVHDFTNRTNKVSSALSMSNAAVRIYEGNTLMQTYIVPKNMTGTVWHVFDIDENGIISINQFYNSENAMGVK